MNGNDLAWVVKMVLLNGFIAVAFTLAFGWLKAKSLTERCLASFCMGAGLFSFAYLVIGAFVTVRG